MKETVKKIIRFIANPHLIICFGIAWIITNGWSYVMLGLGTLFNIKWMIAIASGYLAFLWLPISPEKILTVALAIALLRLIFPNDQKTLAVLKAMKDKIRVKKKSAQKHD